MVLASNTPSAVCVNQVQQNKQRNSHLLWNVSVIELMQQASSASQHETFNLCAHAKARIYVQLVRQSFPFSSAEDRCVEDHA